MRTYHQACGLAKALDVVGDRWALLIVRELLIRRRCRYTDLKRGLPGVATNLLADRLRELEAVGVVVREEAPPPIATTLFSLTDRGLDLERALLALGQWGASLLEEADQEKVFQPHWMVLPLRLALRDARPEAPPIALELRSGGERIAIQAHGRVDVELGAAIAPAAIVSGPGREVLAVMTGKMTVTTARRAGVEIEGDLAALSRVTVADAPAG